MEHCAGGSLGDINGVVDSFHERDIGAVMHGVLQGLTYLHGNKQVHRDVKAGNILLTQDGHIKLGIPYSVAATFVMPSLGLDPPPSLCTQCCQQSSYNETVINTLTTNH